ncbi:DUF1776-domain-containing protein [Mollisia scopiformis]|uniref:DUF1776-domain-containing protein n=1 Tax=Mollisia scopiformis TaxID=149040 RepID=A0A194XX52_MOLSC|nr:DUF1776-domain-containing protein [Mollisia scopiformis]KUJ24362.1 DUF1776-domain-containing protein [Mollisia scopiformis]
MSADDQAFLDILSSVPNDVKRYSSDVADYVDKHLEKVSNTLRDALSSSKWIPESARPKPPPPPPRRFEMSVSPSLLVKLQSWVLNHKILTTFIVLAIGGVTYKVIRRKVNRKKRRAKRASNGARLEVVVIAGSPSEPITRSISLDLERRGFIVYIVCNTIEEEVLVQNESRPDIKPLMLDIVDPESARASIERFTIHLQSPHAAFQGAKPHHLSLCSLILIPSPSYPSSPIATLSPSTLSDLLNTRLLTPILTTQTFLPLLQSSPLQHPYLHTQPKSQQAKKPSVLLLTPSIISSLSPSFHLPESLISTALTTFTQTLTSELLPLDIPVTHLQLGSFDVSSFSPHNKALVPTTQSQRAETLKWDEGTRQAYARNFVAVSSKGAGGVGAIGKGSSLRELNNAVFDAMTSGKAGTVRVGMGSRTYGFVGCWVPRGLVGWMMGVRKVGQNKSEFGRGGDSLVPSRSTSPGSASTGNVHGLRESEYISVYQEDGNHPLPEGEFPEGHAGSYGHDH